MTATRPSRLETPRSESHVTSTCRRQYRFKAAALKKRYRDVDQLHFGCVTIHLPDGASYVVRDFHYPLHSGRLGMQFVPVNDDGPVERCDAAKVPGSSLVDSLLRARMGLRERD